MQSEHYTVTQYSIQTVLSFIENNEIAIPEIQRPFVWKRKQVRDLIDSLYQGYPTGYLIMWQNPRVKLKDGRDSLGKKILIDGQQRVTALMAALLGRSIIDEDYREANIRIAFNPLANDDEERFAVQDSSHLKSKKWIPDIAVFFKPLFSQYSFITEYCQQNPEMTSDKLDGLLMRLKSIANRQLGVVELAPQLSIEEVTEIFIRINSQGKSLSQSDFAMSKIAADEKYGGNMLRKAIDYFCHLTVEPTFFAQLQQRDKEFMESEYANKIKWLKDDRETIYDPDYNDMLRVSFMHEFGRGKLADLVSLLSGRNFDTRVFEESIAEDSFTRLKKGVLNFVNQYKFNQFVLAIKSAGFTTPRLITSKMTIDFAYTLYLMMMDSQEIEKTAIKRYVQKWFVMSVLTGRYVTSPESVFDRDIRNFKSKGFKAFIGEVEQAELSDTFWQVGLVQNLETTSSSSPAFNTYLAAQVFGNERAFLSRRESVKELIEVSGDLHHIFPQEYLKAKGITAKMKYNQVANLAVVDRPLNISIGKKSPSEYLIEEMKQFPSEQAFLANLRINSVPEEIIGMDVEGYDDFLLERRKYMADKIHAYYEAL